MRHLASIGILGLLSVALPAAILMSAARGSSPDRGTGPDHPAGNARAAAKAGSAVPPAAAAKTRAALDAVVDKFFDDCYYRYHPTAGTQSGFHQYDAKLEDLSRAAVDSEVACLKDFRKQFEQIDASHLDAATKSDQRLVLASIDGSLLELETIRKWERNPDQYSSGLSGSIFLIMSRNFAPADERLRSVIARERQAPKVFEAARANLKNPPRIYTEIALEQIPGIIGFFKDSVPAAFTEVKDTALIAEFQASNKGVIDLLSDYEKYLKEDVLPRSNGDFRIGAEVFRQKVKYDEMVDLPLDRLRAIGMEDLRRNQERFKKTAAAIDPKRPPREILADLEKDHPAPDHLLDAFRDTLGGLRDFIATKRIVTIPSPVLPILEETPPFERALTFASMDTPGPYEMVAKEAYFNVTLPESSWTPQQVQEHMAGFNRGTIISTAIHEAYPGHYTQFLWVQKVPSKVRKLLGANSNAEGWAHYCEQMMLDEGYGEGDLKLRLGQLQDALLRNARFIVGLDMHSGKMTFDQGIDFFMKEGFLTHANAERETKRGTSDPTYLVYTLGKLQIMKLREDYKKLRGPKFTLQEFHDRFLGEGYPPIAIARQAMLGNDSPTL
jgi:uncharacterized protein DUF885